jgi:hypothetical protein
LPHYEIFEFATLASAQVEGTCDGKNGYIVLVIKIHDAKPVRANNIVGTTACMLEEQERNRVRMRLKLAFLHCDETSRVRHDFCIFVKGK